MVAVKVKAKITEDNTGVKSHLPILLTEQGELSPVTDYLLHLEANGRSIATLNRVIRATAKLMEYMDANTDAFDDPKRLFQTFTKRLYSGTVGEDGLDPSCLYWIPTSTSETGLLISALTGLTDWLAENKGATHLNPLRAATPHEERLNYAVWYRKNQNDFLGHIKDETISSAAKKARTIKGRTPLAKVDDDAIAFPEPHWNAFYNEGIGGAKNPRVALRDKLILLLMHGGGLRVSEAVSLWITDVFEDPSDPSKAIVRIYDETDGRAPDGWKSRTGDKTRKAYLKESFSRIPRKQMHGTARLGFKSKVVDHKDNYLQVQWFPSDYGRVFMALWKNYAKYRAVTDAFHPYAFVSFGKNSFGSPYTLNAFNYNYASGLRRIGLEPNKAEGLDPHGHRHNYGRRLERADLSPLVIRKCLHHKSLESQLPYTQKGTDEVSRLLSEATERLALPDSKVKPLDWKTLVEHGFEDIDPQGYFTGKHPKLGRK
ncbi:MAG: site-specific integrase [Marinobacter sp.]|uniref:gamma-mobile-trio recombinase GmtY n=1 Tax=Marinobacter sp. TaxID=50741 RepID=UPI001B629A7A|nr:gamma-mobile-trio recombinase GmtY [Marinobacter sp.]MBQ0746555.1 site-specific integrase [Marinobacter sp.]MBQ0814291.1 site-specific integrase [Marinobacter sp.]|tara:strand:- start:22466 stop:23923 length:1458 start_codon:yes stop_codon:yes gene_type:complete